MKEETRLYHKMICEAWGTNPDFSDVKRREQYIDLLYKMLHIDEDFKKRFIEKLTDKVGLIEADIQLEKLNISRYE